MTRARASSQRRRGLEEAQSKDAGRRTGTGSEVWHIRDEWARDHEVLHPQLGYARRVNSTACCQILWGTIE